MFLIGLFLFSLLSWGLTSAAGASASTQEACQTDAASDEGGAEGEGEFDLIAPSPAPISAPRSAHADFSYRFLLPDPVFTAPDEPPNKRG